MKTGNTTWVEQDGYLISDRGVKIDPADLPLLLGKTVSVDVYAHIMVLGKKYRLHKIFCPSPVGHFTDHENRDKLDNRRSNLRIATIGESNINKTNDVSKTSQFRGVSRYRVSTHGGKYVYHYWRATIGVNWQHIALGYFKTEIEAAAAYNKAASELHGEFAQLNSLAA